MKAVFIGSSGAALRQAKLVCKHLQSLGVRVIPWWEAFAPGTVTMEALEDVLERVSGAVLLATPDDLRVRGEQSQHISRDNVILELGMFSSRLGRHNIALLRYDGVTLPTDLSGFTHVKMGAFNPQKEVRSIGAAARRHLSSWAEGLQDLCAGLPRTTLLHGYSGRWHVSMNFERWWDFPVTPPSYVNLNGQIQIAIPASGEGGQGLLVCEIDVVLDTPRSSARFRSVQTLEQISCDSSGAMRLVSNQFCREVVQVAGEPPDAAGFQQKVQGPQRYVSELSPQANSARRLEGHSGLYAGERLLSGGPISIEKLD